MLVSSINFSLHFLAWHRRRLSSYKDPEIKVFLTILALTVVSAITHLLLRNDYALDDAFRFGIFQAVSITTTTGFTNTDFAAWTGSLPMLLIMMSAIGCCAGSMGGGVKVIRFWLLIKQCRREMFCLIHPRAQSPVKIGQKIIEEKILNSVWAFFSAYALILIIGTLLLLSDGMDITGAFSAIAATLHKPRPGLRLGWNELC